MVPTHQPIYIYIYIRSTTEYLEKWFESVFGVGSIYFTQHIFRRKREYNTTAYAQMAQQRYTDNSRVRNGNRQYYCDA